MASRGIRNNNPGNIRHSKSKWQGLAADQPDKSFVKFTDPVYGIRAIARLLIKYQDDHDLDTVKGLIDRWAPPVENNTTAYINRVARDMGVSPTQSISVHNFEYLYPLVEAIIEHENGSNPYTKAQITKGLVLAGVEPKKKSVMKSKEVVGGTAVSGLTMVSLASEHIEKVAPAFSLMEKLAEYAPYAIGLIIILVAGWLIWDRIEDRKKGLR